MVPKDGKVATSTILAASRPTFQNRSSGAVWGYSLSVFTTGDGIPVGARWNFSWEQKRTSRPRKVGETALADSQTFRN
jgi:hypothetical protein